MTRWYVTRTDVYEVTAATAAEALELVGDEPDLAPVYRSAEAAPVEPAVRQLEPVSSRPRLRVLA